MPSFAWNLTAFIASATLLVLNLLRLSVLGVGAWWAAVFFVLTVYFGGACERALAIRRLPPALRDITARYRG